MKRVLCKDVFRTTKFNTYSEFVFMLVIAREFSRRGFVFSLKDMEVNLEEFSEAERDEFWWMVKLGILVDYEYIEDVDGNILYSEIENYRGVDWFKQVDNVFKIEGDSLVWEEEWAKDSYLIDSSLESYLFYGMDKIKNTMLEVVAYHIVNLLLGGDKIKLKVVISGLTARNMLDYIDLYQCVKDLSWLGEWVSVEIRNEFTDRDVKKDDIDLFLLIHNSRKSRSNSLKTVWEKLDLMKEKGYVEGGLYLLVNRTHTNKSNSYGTVESVKLIRIDTIGSDFIKYTQIPVVKTLWERYEEYMGLPLSMRGLDFDFNGGVHQFKETASLYSLGVDRFISDENTTFLVKPDLSEKIDKKVNIEGEIFVMNMRWADAIYWLLSENHVEFNAKLFKKMYSEGKDFLWDRVLNKGYQQNVLAE